MLRASGSAVAQVLNLQGVLASGLGAVQCGSVQAVAGRAGMRCLNHLEHCAVCCICILLTDFGDHRAQGAGFFPAGSSSSSSTCA